MTKLGERKESMSAQDISAAHLANEDFQVRSHAWTAAPAPLNLADAGPVDRNGMTCSGSTAPASSLLQWRFFPSSRRAMRRRRRQDVAAHGRVP